MIPPASIWQIAANTTGCTFTDAQKMVLDFLYEYFQDLYLGVSKSTYTTNDILALSQQLSNQIRPNQKAESFNFLVHGLELGNGTLDWDVPLAPVYFTIKREQNYATQTKFTPINPVDDIISAITTDIESGLPNDDIESLGQILVSAILFGGLINRRWLQPFMKSIQNSTYYQYNNIFWVEMTDQQQATATPNRPIVHRLIPDYLTRTLISHLQQKPLGNIIKRKRTPWLCISAYMKKLNLLERKQPKSLKELMSIAFSRYLIFLPHNLVGYACGDLPAVSLPIEVWLRCLTGKAIPYTKPTVITDEENRPLRVRRIHSNEDCKIALQLELMSKLLKRISRPKTGKLSQRKAKKILFDFRQETKHVLSPTFQLLLYWAERLLEKRTTQFERRNIPALKASSLYRYLSGIGSILLSASENKNLIKIDPGDLELIYEEIAIRKPKETLKLRQFHSFLTAYYDLPELEWTELISGGVAITCISANIIDQKVYSLLMQSLGWGRKHDKWDKLRMIAIILMFRCGLRPSEIRGIRLIDVQGVTRYEILIRKTRLNDTKSIAGVRRIPISDLLTDSELIYLLDFLKTRKAEDHIFGGGLLLAHPTQKKGLLPDSLLYNPARKALKKITHDDSIVLYHLRHSFLSWLSFETQLKDQPNFELVKNTFSLPDRNIDKLLDPILKNEPWNRKLNYIMSLLIGHASPLTTNQHYNHLLDITLGHHLQQAKNSIKLNHKAIMNLTNCSRSQAFVYITNTDKHPLQEAYSLKKMRHPLELTSKKMGFNKQLLKDKQLPPWDEIIHKLINNGLQLSQNDLNQVALIYESIRNFDGRKIKTAKTQLIYAIENYNIRWGGIFFNTYTNANKFINFMYDCRIKKDNIHLVHHPQYGQAKTKQDYEIKKWAKSINYGYKLFKNGEHGKKNIMNQKGGITIKISSLTMTTNQRRSQRMSNSVMPLFKLIHELL